MEERLNQLFAHLKVSPSRFADEIGVQRSNISHLLSGRNKPSFDLMLKILDRYPRINLEWLITGKGNVFKPNTDILPAGTPASADKNPDLFATSSVVNSDNPPVYGLKDKGADKSTVTNVNKLNKVVLFYSDGTFTEYLPSTM